MSTYVGFKGNKYSFGDSEKLAEGGEGVVYKILGNSRQVAKLYKDDHFNSSPGLREITERKLKAMLRFNVSSIVSGKLRLAWPEDILYANGRMVGFVMPVVSSTTKIFSICRTGKARLRLHSDYSWKHAVQYAYLLSWVVDYLHTNGIVIGDMNQNNIIVDVKNSTIVLIDCDSFDITDPITKEHFPCTVGFPEMLAPEIQGCTTLSNAPFSMESDNFSLAIHIFRLLMNNEYPFGGTALSTVGASKSLSDIQMNTDIINGECPYVRNCKYKIRKGSPTLSVLPPNIQELFRRTFYYTPTTVLVNKRKRATAYEWVTALLPLATAQVGGPELAVCYNNTSGGPHIYPAHNISCPWCEIEKQTAQISVQQSTQMNQSTVVRNSTAAANNTQVSYTGSKSTVKRSAGLLYVIMIIFGIVSGFVFNERVGSFVNSKASAHISYGLYGIALAIIGIISGVVVSHLAEDSYIYADSGIPYFFLGLVVLIIPPIIIALLGLAVSLVMVLFEAIAAIVILFCVCSLCGGS